MRLKSELGLFSHPNMTDYMMSLDEYFRDDPVAKFMLSRNAGSTIVMIPRRSSVRFPSMNFKIEIFWDLSDDIIWSEFALKFTPLDAIKNSKVIYTLLEDECVLDD